MIVEDVIYSIGSAHTGLTALVSTRIYPVGKVSEPTRPCVIFTKGRSDPVQGYYTDTGWFYTEVVFEAQAATAREAALVMVQIRAAFARYHGTVSTAKVDDIKTQGNVTAYYDEELACFVEELEFELFHTE